MASIAPLPPAPPAPPKSPPLLTAGDPAPPAAGGAQTRSATLSRSALASQRSLGVSLLWPERTPPPPPPADLGGPSNNPAHPVPLAPTDDCAAAVAVVVPADSDSGGAFLRDSGCRVGVPGTGGAVAAEAGAVGLSEATATATDGVAAVAEDADTTSFALRAWSS